MDKKISVSDLRREAERLTASGRMPTFEQLVNAIASSPAAQELMKMRLSEHAGKQQKN